MWPHPQGLSLVNCGHTIYHEGVTSKGSRQRKFRLEDDAEWWAFEAAARRQGTDRSSLLRDFIAYYLRRPGAKMPRRPDAVDIPAVANTPAADDDD